MYVEQATVEFVSDSEAQITFLKDEKMEVVAVDGQLLCVIKACEKEERRYYLE